MYDTSAPSGTLREAVLLFLETCGRWDIGAKEVVAVLSEPGPRRWSRVPPGEQRLLRGRFAAAALRAGLAPGDLAAAIQRELGATLAERAQPALAA